MIKVKVKKTKATNTWITKLGYLRMEEIKKG